MPATSPEITNLAASQLVRLGAELRRLRKAQQVNSTATAEAAGISRVTLHRIEKGEPSVSMGAWAAAAEALGVQMILHDERATASGANLPQRLRVEEYPQLHKLAWQLQSGQELTPREALQLYERNWRHLDRLQLGLKEIALIRALADTFGAGDLLV